MQGRRHEITTSESIVVCRTCHGRGQVVTLDEIDLLGYHEPDTLLCPTCKGSGVLRRVEKHIIYYTEHLPSARQEQNKQLNN